MVNVSLGQQVQQLLQKDLTERIIKGQSLALQNALQQLYIFLLTNGIIPRDTGFMASTAVHHLFDTAADGSFRILIWFDTFYAEYVNNNLTIGSSNVLNYNKDFLDRCKPLVEQIISTSLIEGLTSQGLVNVKVTF